VQALFDAVKVERQDQRLECLHGFTQVSVGFEHRPFAVKLTTWR